MEIEKIKFSNRQTPEVTMLWTWLIIVQIDEENRVPVICSNNAYTDVAH